MLYGTARDPFAGGDEIATVEVDLRTGEHRTSGTPPEDPRIITPAEPWWRRWFRHG
jgi:hypothetical protein